jgi:hypothetical protein
MYHHLVRGLLACAVLACAGLWEPPSAVAQDQTGAVAGVVVDEANGETLPGANVSIEGTTTGTSTDLNGRYRLKGLAPGTYDLVVSFVGFQQKTVTGVEVTAGTTTRLDVGLREQTAQLEEVVVTAEAAQDSEAGLLSKRAKAASVSNAISAELMSQSGASTAADAMKKVTGASVVDGKYVYIRGLGDRYTKAQLNGLDLPTASADRNAVQFDLFSSSLLESITTQKTFTPDRPGNFAGGLIDITSESYPSDLTFTLSSSMSAGTQTHFHDNFLSYDGGRWDFLGFDDGTRAIPNGVSGLPADLVPQDAQTARREVREEVNQNNIQSLDELGEAGQRLNQFSRAFNNTMAPTLGSAPISQSYSIGVGNEIEALGNPLGFLVNVNYGYSASYNEGFTGRYRGPLAGGEALDEELLVDESVGSTEASIGGLASANYTVAQNHEFGTTIMYSRRGESETSRRFGRWPEQFGADSTVFFQDRNLRYTERELYSTQLRGQHLLPALSDLKLEWAGGYSDTRQEEPDTRVFGNLLRTQFGSDGSVDTTYTADLNGFDNPTRFFRDLSESSYSGKLDVSLPFKGFGDGTSKVKVGGAYSTDDRSFSERTFVFDPSSSGVDPFAGDPNHFFRPENRGVVDIETVREGTPFEAQRPLFGIIPFESTEPEDLYTGDRTISAGYAMVDAFLTDWLRVVGGARVERTDMQVDSEAILSDSSGVIEETDVLPALNVVVQLQENMNLRSAASRTIARPTFREMAPFSRRPFVLGETILGNPDLGRTLITNLDLRWEWFPTAGELVAVSVFAKDFQDAIEVNLLQTTNGQRTWDNTDAQLFGAEFEVRTRLGRFVDAFEYVTVGTNLSLIQSEAEVPDSDRTRSLQGQSPYTFNFDVTYDNPETGTTTGLYFNTFGERLTAFGLAPKPNVFEQPFHELNFTFTQRVSSHWTLDLSVDNMLGDTKREVHPFSGNEFVYQRTPQERSISVGVSYEL